jgi:hypothetical protein
MASTWDIMTFTLTGTLGLGILIGAKSEHHETTEGWTPPAMMDGREPAPPFVKDWLSPATLRRLSRGGEAPGAPELPDSDEPPAKSAN